MLYYKNIVTLVAAVNKGLEMHALDSTSIV